MTELVIGGSGSGKSAYAEKLCVKLHQSNEPMYYVATMEPYGPETLKKIDNHRKMRKDAGFKTIEKYTDINKLEFEKNSTVLIECISNLAANEMFELHEKKADEKILLGIKKIIENVKNVIIVTNDIFFDESDYDADTVKYMETLGNINYMLAKNADNVTYMLFSNPIKYKEGYK